MADGLGSGLGCGSTTQTRTVVVGIGPQTRMETLVGIEPKTKQNDTLTAKDPKQRDYLDSLNWTH